MAQIFNIQEDKVVIDKLALKYTEGAVVHAGSLAVVGQLHLHSNMQVNGEISATTIRVKNLITESGGPGGDFQWEGSKYLKLVDDRISITSLELATTQGTVDHTGDIGVTGNVSANNIEVTDTIRTDTLRVKNIITEFKLGDEQVFSIKDDKVVIYKAKLKYTEGSVVHAGSFDIQGKAAVQSDLTVKGTVFADTINVKNVVTENGNPLETGNWFYHTEQELVGRGLAWSSANTVGKLNYKIGNRLWTNMSVDLDEKAAYKIDGTDVLSLGTLGNTITKSNLRELGTLKSLMVSGNAQISDFAYFNSTFGRLGLGTDEPRSALHILDQNIEFIAGSVNPKLANIGTYTSHDLAVITDNATRILIKNTGEVIFGDANSKSASVTINGTLKVDNIIADTRIERSSPIEFIGTRDNSIYNKGLIWSEGSTVRSFILKGDFESFYSSENINLAKGKGFHIGKNLMLSETELGSTVATSNLTSVGRLLGLAVDGEAVFTNEVRLDGTTRLHNAEFGADDQQLTIKKTGINTNNVVAISVNEDEVFYSDRHETTVGNKNNNRKPVKLYGPVGIGKSNTDPTVGLAVGGDIEFGGKKFINRTEVPTEGEFNQGDICWNSNPTNTSYVGWVCVSSGSPGEWLPFGGIGRT